VLATGKAVTVPGHPPVHPPGRGTSQGKLEESSHPSIARKKRDDLLHGIGPLPHLSGGSHKVEGPAQSLWGEIRKADPDLFIPDGQVLEVIPPVHSPEATDRSQADGALPIIEEGVAEWPLHDV
jgi:hypothetical protein